MRIKSASCIGGQVADASVLHVGSGRQYTTLDSALAALSGQTWKSSTAATGTVTMTAGSAAVSGAGTAFLTEIQPNDYITVGSYTEPVKSIESNTALTLWSGSRANAAGAAATVKKLSKFKILVYGSHSPTAGILTLPTGVGLEIQGAPTTSATIELPYTSGATRCPIILPANHCGRIAVDGLYIPGELVGGASLTSLFAGSFGTGRGIYKFQNTDIESCLMLWAHGACLDVRDVDLLDASFNCASDYIYFEDVYHHGSSYISDWGLFYGSFTTDTGHDVRFNRWRLHNDAPQLTASSNAGWEYNSCQAGKQLYVTNSELLQSAAPAMANPDAGLPSMIIMHHGTDNGDYHFIDCTIESFGGLQYDLGDGSLVASEAVLTRTYRRDGITIPTIYRYNS